MEATHEPVWTLQAALWHNLADTYRSRMGNDPVAAIYFVQLDSIRCRVEHQSDRVFLPARLIWPFCNTTRV
jgi:hypothetical protein